jgi:hypothetical protein
MAKSKQKARISPEFGGHLSSKHPPTVRCQRTNIRVASQRILNLIIEPKELVVYHFASLIYPFHKEKPNATLTTVVVNPDG